MTLREQIAAIAAKRCRPLYVEQTSFPQVVQELALQAFEDQWVEGQETAAVRCALRMLRGQGEVPLDTPAVGWVVFL